MRMQIVMECNPNTQLGYPVPNVAHKATGADFEEKRVFLYFY